MFQAANQLLDKLRVTKKLTYDGIFGHENVKSQLHTANDTMAEGDSGLVHKCGTDAVVFTLPATVVGYTYTFMNVAEDGTAAISISPGAVDKIMGAGLTSEDNKDLINTKSTAKKGDFVTLVGDGVNGWFVTAMAGTWAREA